MLSVTMLSNAMSHHQIPFCDCLAARDDVDFRFVATKSISDERLGMGYTDLNKSRDYIIRSYENEESFSAAMEYVDKSDFVIWGSAPYKMIRKRIVDGKWTFINAERLFKKGLKDKLNLKKMLKLFTCFATVPHKHLGLLCSSAYSYSDYSLFGIKKNNAYKWGYFPPNRICDNTECVSGKIPNSIVWVARMIDWKHPEMAINTAKLLHDEGMEFSMTVIGDGVLFNKVKQFVKDNALSGNVDLKGSLENTEVRRIMEQSEILLTTSDFNEGWGAVVNEGMSSGCAVVASHAMGSVPYLIEDGKNGIIFHSGDEKDLYNKLRPLLSDRNKCMLLGKNAIDSINNKWNGKIAAERIVELFSQIKNGNNLFSFDSGICSRADKLSNNWYED